MGYEAIHFQRDGAVATLTFNRPQAMNSLSRDIMTESSEALAICENSADIRVVIIRGEGRAFCAGADVNGLSELSGDSGARMLYQVVEETHDRLIMPIRRMAKPVIAAVNGVAAGAGLGIALSCDLRVAAEEARFVMAYSNVGISPDCGASFFLPRLVGPAKAMELYLFNEVLTAQQAHNLGIVNRVAASSELMSTVQEMAQRLAQGPTAAYSQTKQLISRSFANDLASHLKDEALSVGNCAATHDHAEAVKAFLAKRPPQFKGR